jgi:hypothetical protein
MSDVAQRRASIEIDDDQSASIIGYGHRLR